MFTKFNLIAGIAAAIAIAHDIKTKADSVKAAQLYMAAHEAAEQNERALMAQVNYLSHRLNEAGVPMNEFDRIAMNYHEEM